VGEIYRIIWDKKVEKQLSKVPRYIAEKFYTWVSSVKLVGLRKVREQPGYHDEPLKGKRKGQRSIRLSRGYRAIYIEGNSGSIELVEVIEVNKHEY
jgi:proteic killer suppression protein